MDSTDRTRLNANAISSSSVTVIIKSLLMNKNVFTYFTTTISRYSMIDKKKNFFAAARSVGRRRSASDTSLQLT